MSEDHIALALGITRPTLRKHFEVELSTGAHQRRMEVLVAQFRAAKKGNVAAQKAFLQNSPALAVPPLPKEPAAGAAKKPAIGKKEQAAADAVTAAEGTEWGDLLPRGAGEDRLRTGRSLVPELRTATVPSASGDGVPHAPRRCKIRCGAAQEVVRDAATRCHEP